MAKYRKKPIIIDAVQWDGENVPSELDGWGVLGYHVMGGRLTLDIDLGRALFPFEAPPRMRVNKGDYIVHRRVGDMYIVGREIFERTHDLITVE